MEGSEIPANDNYEVAESSDESAAVEAAEAEPPVEGDAEGATEDGVETEALEGDEPGAIAVAEGEAPVIPRAANDDVAGLDVNADDGTVVIGRLPDTQVASEWDGYQKQELQANPNANEFWQQEHDRGATDLEPGWSPENNDAWVQSIIDQRLSVYLGSPEAGNLVDPKRGDAPTVYKTELDKFRAAGYTQVGDYLVPPDR
jgi:hypothetical protein